MLLLPGVLLDYLGDEKFSAEDLEILVLDEADRMLDMGFKEPVQQIVNEAMYLKQRLLFSATTDSHSLAKFSTQVLDNPEFINVEPPRRERGKILQRMHVADTLEHKQQLLVHLLREYNGGGRRGGGGGAACWVFVRKRERAHDLANFLSQLGFGAAALEGGLPQDERQKTHSIVQQYSPTHIGCHRCCGSRSRYSRRRTRC